MPRKNAKTLADLQVTIIIEHVTQMFRTLKEGEDATKLWLARQLDERFEPVNEQLMHIRLRLGQHDKRFDALDTRFDAMDTRFDAMDTRFDAMDTRFDAMDTRFDAMDTRFDAMDTRFNGVEATLQELKTRFDRLADTVTRHDAEIITLGATHRGPPPRKSRATRG